MLPIHYLHYRPILSLISICTKLIGVLVCFVHIGRLAYDGYTLVSYDAQSKTYLCGDRCVQYGRYDSCDHCIMAEWVLQKGNPTRIPRIHTCRKINDDIYCIVDGLTRTKLEAVYAVKKFSATWGIVRRCNGMKFFGQTTLKYKCKDHFTTGEGKGIFSILFQDKK